MPFGLEAAPDLVDPLGDDEHRPVGLLGQEVAQRAVEAAGEADAVALARREREGAADAERLARVGGEEAPLGLGAVQAEEELGRGIDEVEDAGDGDGHGRDHTQRPARGPGTPGT